MESEVLQDIAAAVDAVPGVIRRERSLADWSRLMPATRATDGVRIVRSGDALSVEVELTAAKELSALDVGREVRERVRLRVEAAGLDAEHISVRILAQE